MSKTDFPITPAIRVLRDKKISFVPYQYEYEEKGGTKQTSVELKVEEHIVIKTLVLEADGKNGLIMLMHGDKEVSLKELARSIGAKQVAPCSADKATKLTGYQFGGTSPFGTRASMPVFVESTIMQLEKIYINGGKRGFIIEITPQDLVKVFDLNEVNVAI